jgi:hypothetical protein
MVTTTTSLPVDARRGLIAGTWFAGTCNLLATLLALYEALNYPHDVNDVGPDWDALLYFSPLLAIFLFRRIRGVVLTYGLMLAVILGARIYSLVELRLIGVRVFPHFDWADFLLMMLSLVSFIAF